MKKQTENTTSNAGSVPGKVVTGVALQNAEDSPVATTLGTDLERLQAENEQLKTTIRRGAAHRQITGELAKAGARSPELLFESVKADLQFAANGRIENAPALIEKLKAGFPEQFGYQHPASIDAGAGTGGGNTLTREALAKMKPAEIAKLDWTDVRRVLSGS